MRSRLMLMFSMLGLLAAGTAIGAQPASARYEGPWCAHMSVGKGFIDNRCDMASYEMCHAEIMATPGTWCTQNPYYRGPASEPRRRKAQRRVR